MLSLHGLLSALLLRRLSHSKLLWRVLGVLLMLEGLLVMSWCLYMLNRPPGHLHYAIAVLATHVIALLAFLCGGRAEQQRGWLTRLSRALEPPRSCYGDVALGEYLL